MHLKRLRELRLAAPPQPGRPLHLAAASGLVRVDALFFVVADDELQLGVFDVDSDAPGRLIRVIDGELPTAADARKKHKPDFEALTLLQPFDGYPRGALLALGSGSKKHRRRGVLLRVDRHGVDGSSARVIDAANLFEALDREIDDLNIEGAVVRDDRLVLMHRGNKRHAANALVDFSLHAILDHHCERSTLCARSKESMPRLPGIVSRCGWSRTRTIRVCPPPCSQASCGL